MFRGRVLQVADSGAGSGSQLSQAAKAFKESGYVGGPIWPICPETGDGSVRVSAIQEKDTSFSLKSHARSPVYTPS